MAIERAMLGLPLGPLEFEVILPRIAVPFVHEGPIAFQRNQLGTRLFLRDKSWRYRDLCLELLLPGVEVGTQEWTSKFHFDRKFKLRPGTDVVAQPCIGFATTSENKHHGPLRPAKYTRKGLFIGSAGLRRVRRVRMQPVPGKRLGLATAIELFIEKVRHGIVVELHGRPRAGLPDKCDVFHEQQVIRWRDSEGSNFRGPGVTQKKELGPGHR